MKWTAMRHYIVHVWLPWDPSLLYKNLHQLVHFNPGRSDQDWRPYTNWIGPQTVLIGPAEMVEYWFSPPFSGFFQFFLSSVTNILKPQLASSTLPPKVKPIEKKIFRFKGSADIFPSHQQCYWVSFKPNIQKHFKRSTSIKYWFSRMLLNRRGRKP